MTMKNEYLFHQSSAIRDPHLFLKNPEFYLDDLLLPNYCIDYRLFSTVHIREGDLAMGPSVRTIQQTGSKKRGLLSP